MNSPLSENLDPSICGRSCFHALKEACGIERLAPDRRGWFHTRTHLTDNGPSKLARLFFQEVAWLILYCARRTRPFRGRAFREQEDDQATSWKKNE